MPWAAPFRRIPRIMRANFELILPPGNRFDGSNCQWIVPTDQAWVSVRPTVVGEFSIAGGGRARAEPPPKRHGAREDHTMNRKTRWGSGSAVAQAAFALVAVLSIPVPAAWAQEPDARSILKSMSDYLSRQENLSLKYDADV